MRGMDLGTCPRCGEHWASGLEQCTSCGYIAIGAGLKNLPKKKKKKVKKYVEPGSATPFLSFTLIALLFWTCFYLKPWEDDWDLARTFLGGPRHHSVKGDWVIVKTLKTYGSSDGVFDSESVSAGEMQFNDDQKVVIHYKDQNGSIQATGDFSVEQTQVTITNVQGIGKSAGRIPKDLVMNLAWPGSDDLVATIAPGEALQMHKKRPSDPAPPFEHMQLGQNSDAPEAMRGAFATLKGGGN